MEKRWIKYHVDDISNGLRIAIKPGKAYNVEELHEDYRGWCKEYSMKEYPQFAYEKEIKKCEKKVKKARKSNLRKGVYKILENEEIENIKEIGDVFCSKCLWFKKTEEKEYCRTPVIRKNYKQKINLARNIGRPKYMNRYNNCKRYIYNLYNKNYIGEK